MTLRVAINGFGRIGRLVFRLLHEREGIKVVAINDLVDVPTLTYLLKYDTVHGQFGHIVKALEGAFEVDGQKTIVTSERNPEKLPWKNLEVDIVVESTGIFRSRDDAAQHLKAGAKRVIISAPAKGDDVPTFVMGVNHQAYNPNKDTVVSNASCTTNCLAPLTKILLDNFGIDEGLMTTVHAATASQPTVDGPSQKDPRGGRAAGHNIVPASTGAAKAVALCLPEIKGKLTGMAFRVPVLDVSVVDLTVRLSRPTSYKELCETVKKASQGDLKGILDYCEDDVVSSDFIGCQASCIFDAKAGISLNDKFFKLVCWYDNEMGYSARIVDLLGVMTG